MISAKMDYYEEEKKARKERAKKEKIREDLQKELREAIKDDNSFNGIRHAIMRFVVGKTIGTIAGGTNREVEESYEALLEKLDEGGDDILQNYIEAKGEFEYMILIECMEKAIDFMLEHLGIIVEEMNKAVDITRKRKLNRKYSEKKQE